MEMVGRNDPLVKQRRHMFQKPGGVARRDILVLCSALTPPVVETRLLGKPTVYGPAKCEPSVRASVPEIASTLPRGYCTLYINFVVWNLSRVPKD